MDDTFAGFRDRLMTWPELDQGFWLDLSRARLPGADPATREALLAALAEMRELEAGAMANPDEGRKVGHYWLRAPELAPEKATGDLIRQTQAAIARFASGVHSGAIRGADGPFADLLCIGIGGSALGPQFLADALGGDRDRLRLHFLDNTDPDGFDRVLRGLEGRLGRTLAVVMSKSGGTPEPRNALREAEARWRAAGLDFGRHAVAVTGEGSELDRSAAAAGFLARFPMWDWVGGRTSVMGPVGLVPAALQGLDTEGLLAGAAEMDAITREPDPDRNPAAQLARAWLHLTEGRAKRAMVVLPYKDRLVLLSRYLQQLVMESLGKSHDRSGRLVRQGLTVYGNKGSTDQHAYIQQLRDGPDDFFAVFVEVLRDREGPSPEVEPGVTSGDYLQAFLLGTREALTAEGKASLTLTVGEVDARAIGRILALFERAVGLYASLLNLNAYHQPGVEAGKKAAGEALRVLASVRKHLAERPLEWLSAPDIAAQIGLEGAGETVFKLCLRLSRNGRLECTPHADPSRTLFRHLTPTP
jgi:glucose-6-phosphate isomerase